jgi:hypothetical protein
VISLKVIKPTTHFLSFITGNFQFYVLVKPPPLVLKVPSATVTFSLVITSIIGLAFVFQNANLVGNDSFNFLIFINN